MYYRRKIALALLQIFDETMGKTKFQKLLLLLSKMQEKQDYQFVPYKYGCFSFQAMADVNTMEKYKQVSVSREGIAKIDPKDYLALLKQVDRQNLNKLFSLHGKENYRDLIRYTYTQYPYFAINSAIADRFLTDDELVQVSKCKPRNNRIAMYTIGYEGVSLEDYLNKLISIDVKVLIDVKNNPVSMKYGFTQGQLSNACSKVGIDYVHFPEVGIKSEQRRDLSSQEDYDLLFDLYRGECLPKTIDTQQKILTLIREKGRIALTCFEANVCQCHRKHLAEAITRLPEWHYELIHL
jgi:hypothetical protein